MQRRIFLMGIAGALASACKKPAATAQPLTMVVHKSEGCVCCDGWVRHMRTAGFAVEVRAESNMNEIKTRVGVPVGKGSCHTAVIDGYFVEGHVPAPDVQRLLAERRGGKGLGLPGVPPG